MNYLAHLFLSGDNPSVMVGNFIGDHVKGRRFNRYPEGIKEGILLHRHIDHFTDRHPVFRQSISIFRPVYKRYSGVVCDVVYDHFLALNWDSFSEEEFRAFIKRTHRILIQHYFVLPWQVKQFLPFLIKSRRLETYRDGSGIKRTLDIMASHSSLPDHGAFALQLMEENKQELEQQFHAFMPEIIASSRKFLANSHAAFQP